MQAAREVNSAGRVEAELVRVTDSEEAERLLRSQVLTDWSGNQMAGSVSSMKSLASAVQ